MEKLDFWDKQISKVLCYLDRHVNQARFIVGSFVSILTLITLILIYF